MHTLNRLQAFVKDAKKEMSKKVRTTHVHHRAAVCIKLRVAGVQGKELFDPAGSLEEVKGISTYIFFPVDKSWS
jgi:hypothetical protein